MTRTRRTANHAGGQALGFKFEQGNLLTGFCHLQGENAQETNWSTCYFNKGGHFYF